jgi:phosphatidylglycerol:prolipoprotein diacylglycerol transferase
MHPVVTVLHLGDRELPIGSYGVMLCLALAVVALGVLRAAHRAGLDLGACVAALATAVAAGFAGAVLLHALAQCLRHGTLQALLLPPGMAFFGAALGAGAVLPLCQRWFGVPVLALADLSVPALCLGHALGRIGCLLGGCCFGRPWEGALAIHYVDPLAPAAALAVGRHPYPIYEATGLLVLGVTFALLPLRDPGSGRRLLAYAAGYSLLRLLLEPLRGDAIRGVFLGGALSTAQLIAGGALIACGLLALRRRRRAYALEPG